MSRTFVTFAGEVIRETDRAVLFRFDEIETLEDRLKWVPRSVCESGDEISTGDTDVVIQDWWAEKEGLA